jgi:hypothetical protein
LPGAIAAWIGWTSGFCLVGLLLGQRTIQFYLVI